MPPRVLLLWLALSWPAAASAGDPCVLLIGDSHLAGTMGAALDGRLRDLPATVATYASCGSHPGWWLSGYATRCGYWQRDRDGKETRSKTAPTPLARSLLIELTPDYTVIAQGTNLLEGPPGWQEKASRELLAVVAAAPTKCIWIGPPNVRAVGEDRQAAFYEMLSRILPEYSCQLVDSRPFATYPATGGDGTHYDSLGEPGRALARKWAEGVSAEVERSMGAPRESTAGSDDSASD
jgi:hypothetical protein